MSDLTGVKVGETLFYLSRESRGIHKTGDEWVVLKVGRDWLTVKPARMTGLERRVSRATGFVDGGRYSSPGTMYRSMSEIRDFKEHGKLLALLRAKLDWSSGQSFSLDQLRAASQALGINTSPIEKESK